MCSIRNPIHITFKICYENVVYFVRAKIKLCSFRRCRRRRLYVASTIRYPQTHAAHSNTEQFTFYANNKI